VQNVILGRGLASGKVILFGEHAVVYGRPALAVPATQVQAEAVVEIGAPGSGLMIVAADLGEQIVVRDAPADQPLAAAARLALTHLGLADPDWRLTVHSTIPVASGMGSGAAVSAAIVRALADAASGESANQRINESINQPFAIRHSPFALSAAELSPLVYEVEKLHHGTPSGIDNTVIATGQPVYFVRGQSPQPFPIGRPFWLVIADTGIRSPTKITVGDVRLLWQREPARYEMLFDRIGAVAEAARAAICAGQTEALGPLMDANHALLQEIGVSCAELDALVAAARAAGAFGAKLSGGGRGGNMIALVTADTAPRVAEALTAAGAVRVIVTTVAATATSDRPVLTGETAHA
jgi:mevalonate kinase